MIDDSIIAELEEMMRHNRPVFGDLTVGDITEETMPLLKEALDGDERSRSRLLYMLERRQSKLGEALLRGPFQNEYNV